ncbi:hypothetical protein ACIOHA_33580 [Streptomyces anulatus]
MASDGCGAALSTPTRRRTHLVASRRPMDDNPDVINLLTMEEAP